MRQFSTVGGGYCRWKGMRACAELTSLLRHPAWALARDGPCSTLVLPPSTVCDRASRWAPVTASDGGRLQPVLGAGRPSVLAGGATPSSDTVSQRCAIRTTMAIGGKWRACGVPLATVEEHAQPVSPIARRPLLSACRALRALDVCEPSGLRCASTRSELEARVRHLAHAANRSNQRKRSCPLVPPTVVPMSAHICPAARVLLWATASRDALAQARLSKRLHVSGSCRCAAFLRT
eukprot:scaffold3013_cov316-Prasinococcus_capsulatus_cf.AAC.5